MKKAQLTLNDVSESGFKILEVLDSRMMVSQIAIRTGLGATTIRRLLQRLEVFGLVDEVLVDQAKHFSLTKDGRLLVKRILKAKAPPPSVPADTAKEAQAPVKNEPESKAVEAEPFDLAKWLRQKAQGLRMMADELNAMADDLAHYEE